MYLLMILRVKRSVLLEHRYHIFLSDLRLIFLPLREVTASVFVLKESTIRCANMSSLLVSPLLLLLSCLVFLSGMWTKFKLN